MKCTLLQNPLIKFDKPAGEESGFSLQLNLGWLVPLFVVVFLVRTIFKEIESKDD